MSDGTGVPKPDPAPDDWVIVHFYPNDRHRPGIIEVGGGFIVFPKFIDTAPLKASMDKIWNEPGHEYIACTYEVASMYVCQWQPTSPCGVYPQ